MQVDIPGILKILLHRLKDSGLDAWAGVITAMVFYAEYVGYGVSIGGRLTGLGLDGKALGTLMVFGAVLACGVGSIFARGVILAGPRAASVMVFGLGLEAITAHSELPSKFTSTTLGMFLMLLAAAVTQIFGTFPKIQHRFSTADVSLTRGFMFASAVSIVAGMAFDHLAGCMAANWAMTLSIFAGSVGVGVGFQFISDKFAKLRPLGTLGLPVAMMLAWAAFDALTPYFSNGPSDKCNTLGTGGFQLEALANQMPLLLIWRSGFDGISFPVLFISAGYGLLLGLVMLIESLTALESLTLSGGEVGSVLETDWPRNVRVSAAVNLVSSAFGLACSSWSTSRSKLLEQAQARSRLASVIHGVSIVLITVIAMPWMSRIPVLAIAVALTLVAIQMIDSKTLGLWQPGYQTDAPPQKLWEVWWFWLVLLIALISRQAIYGFVAASIIFWGQRLLFPEPRSVRV